MTLRTKADVVRAADALGVDIECHTCPDWDGIERVEAVCREGRILSAHGIHAAFLWIRHGEERIPWRRIGQELLDADPVDCADQDCEWCRPAPCGWCQRAGCTYCHPCE